MAASGDHRRDGADSPNQLTIEQLAAQSGMSVRNIRSHQARGLLSPPEVRLRVGYYGPEHVAQLRLIRDLQAEGFNLAGIKRLLDDTQGTAERLMRFKESITEHREPAETLTLAELGRRFRVSGEQAPRVLAQAENLGVLVYGNHRTMGGRNETGAIKTKVFVLEGMSDNLSWPLFMDSYTRNEVSTNAGGLVIWPARLMVPIGFFLLILQGVSELIKRIAIMRGIIPDPYETQRSALEAEVEYLVEGSEKR